MDDRKLSSHLRLARYGDFTLTDAVRPAPSASAVPTQGYRVEMHRDDERGLHIPMLLASASKEILFDLFLDLLQPLGETVDVVLESSHGEAADFHTDLRRTDIDVPVLASHCCDFEDLLLNDGCTGISAVAPNVPAEVQLDEHKLIVIYARKLSPFRRILRKYGVRRRDEIKLVCDAEHYHCTSPDYADQLSVLATRLGAGAETNDIDEWEESAGY